MIKQNWKFNAKTQKWRYSKHNWNYMGFFWALIRRYEIEHFGWRFDIWIFRRANTSVCEGQQHMNDLPHQPDPQPVIIKDVDLKRAVNPKCEPIMVAACKFIPAYSSGCTKPAIAGRDYCPEHSDKWCVSCGAHATHECNETYQFVCGFPLCDNCVDDGQYHHHRK